MWGEQATDWILPILWAVARKYERGVYGEIGTRAGISTMALALAARESGGKVYTMDIGTDHRADAEQNLGVIGLRKHVAMMTCDSSKTDFPEPLDVLFIDGDHSYDGVFADYERHSQNVKDGGTILFHDPCSCEEVGELVHDIGGTIISIEAGLGIVSKGHHLPGGEIHAKGIQSERVGNGVDNRGSGI
jgi:hypothetical protein